jgi:hypothetical protein
VGYERNHSEHSRSSVALRGLVRLLRKKLANELFVLRQNALRERCIANGATIVLRKIDAAGRPVRQIELCDRHAEAVIARERARGFEIFDRRD